MLGTLRDSFNDALRARSSTASPIRRGGAARRLRSAVAYATLWFVYGVIAKSSQDLNADMAEMVVWTRELALGYPEAPAAARIGLVGVVQGLSVRRLGLSCCSRSVTVSAGIFLAIELCAEWLAKREARGRSVSARHDPVLQFPRPEVRPELDADPALGARDVGDAARARHAASRLGGACRARRRGRDAGEILVGVPDCRSGARGRHASQASRLFPLGARRG